MPVSGAFTTEPLGAAAFAGAADADFELVGSGTGAALARLCGAAAEAITTWLPCTALRLRTTTRVPPAEINLGEATPIGDHSQAVDDLNEGGVIGREWQVGREANATAALPLSRSRRHVWHWGSRGWQGALDES